MRKSLTIAVATLTSAIATTTAFAEQARSGAFIKHGQAPAQAFDLSFLAGNAGIFDLGTYDIGARFGFRVMSPGFIPRLNNSVSVEIGTFIFSETIQDHQIGHRSEDYHASYITIPVQMRWDFHVHPRWTAFGMAGATALFLQHDDWNSNTTISAPDTFRARPSIGIGAFFQLNDNGAIRMEVEPSFPALSRVGYTIKF
jgi:hypothetical protein